jgi:hypothetical protein
MTMLQPDIWRPRKMLGSVSSRANFGVRLIVVAFDFTEQMFTQPMLEISATATIWRASG